MANALVHVVAQSDPALDAIGADAVAQQVSPTTMLETTTDAHGRFRLSVPKGQLYRVWATSANLAFASRPRHRLRPDAAVRLALVRASSLTIEIRNNTAPVAWQVWGTDREQRQEFLRGYRTASGKTVELGGFAPGHYRIRIFTRAGASAETEVNLGPHVHKRTSVTLRNAARIELAGSRAGKNRASVDVLLPALLAFPGEARRQTRSELSLPAFGERIQLGITWPGRPTVQHGIGPLRPGTVWRIPQSTDVGRTLELRLRTSTAAPAFGTVSVSWHSNGRVLRRRAAVSDGLVTLGAMPRTELLVFVFERSGERLIQSIRAPSAAGATRPIRLRTEPAASASLLARGADGAPLRLAKLVLFPHRLPHAIGHEADVPTIVRYPDRRGRFELAALPPGDYEARIEAPFHAPYQERITLRSGQRTLRRFDLERGFRLHGEVRDAGGRPVAGVLVTSSYPLASPRTSPLETLTDAHGAFAFLGVPEGRYILEARRSRGAHTELARQSDAQPGLQPIRLTLHDEDPTIR